MWQQKKHGLLEIQKKEAQGQKLTMFSQSEKPKADGHKYSIAGKAQNL